MIEYKCEGIGITVITINEAYTSKCSFLDNENICKHNKFQGVPLRFATGRAFQSSAIAPASSLRFTYVSLRCGGRFALFHALTQV